MRRWREYLEYQSRYPARVTFTLDPVTPRHQEPNMNHQMGRQYSDQQAQDYIGPGQDFQNDSPMISRQMNGSNWFADQFNFRDREPRWTAFSVPEEDLLRRPSLKMGRQNGPRLLSYWYWYVLPDLYWQIFLLLRAKSQKTKELERVHRNIRLCPARDNNMQTS